MAKEIDKMNKPINRFGKLFLNDFLIIKNEIKVPKEAPKMMSMAIASICMGISCIITKLIRYHLEQKTYSVEINLN